MTQYSYKPTLQFTPASTEIDKFIAFAITSGLTSFTTLRDACAEFDTTRTDDDAVNELCSHLIACEVLTDWQCDMLRMGKYKGFYLDDFCLLRRLGKTNTTVTYLARQSSNGKLVSIDVTPYAIDPEKDGRIHYTVREFPGDSSVGNA